MMICPTLLRKGPSAGRDTFVIGSSIIPAIICNIVIGHSLRNQRGTPSLGRLLAKANSRPYYTSPNIRVKYFISYDRIRGQIRAGRYLNRGLNPIIDIELLPLWFSFSLSHSALPLPTSDEVNAFPSLSAINCWPFYMILISFQCLELFPWIVLWYNFQFWNNLSASD